MTELMNCEPAFSLRCEETPFIPDVDPTSWQGVHQLRKRRTELLCDDLNRVAQSHALGPSDILLINSLRHWSLEAVLEWLERTGADRAPTVILVLHYTPYPQSSLANPAAEAYKEAFCRIADSPLASRIVLCTDSERLRTEYQSLHDVPIAVLPVPHCSEPQFGRRRDNGALSIVFAGEARSDKGFHLLPSAIHEILNGSPKPDIVFNIQAYAPDGNQQPLPWPYPADEEAVRFIPEPLHEKEYEAFLAGADLMLIPYLENPYKTQTSGVYCEAAAFGIPVVVPAGTWMADQVEKSGAGVLFTPGDASSLAEACLEALRNYPSLREAATQAASSWRSFHNARNFVACLEMLLQSLPNVPQT